jgi:hypothetical protein
MKKFFIWVIVIGLIVAGAVILTRSSETITYESPNVPEVLRGTEEPEVEKARKELEQATKRLAEEEARILAEIQEATSTAQAKIEAIEADRNAVVSAKEAELAKINEIRSSF